MPVIRPLLDYAMSWRIIDAGAASQRYVLDISDLRSYLVYMFKKVVHISMRH